MTHFCVMPANAYELTTCQPLDACEERQVRRLTHSVHAPADWITHANIVTQSWDGLRTRQIAEEVGRDPQTVLDHPVLFRNFFVGIEPPCSLSWRHSVVCPR
jgi:hypothetical protein